MRLYIVIFRFKKPGDKAAGPFQQYRLYARDLEQARVLAREYGNYQGVEVVNVVPA